MQFDLTDEQRAIQDTARRFTAEAITPNAAQWDEKCIFPRTTIKAAAELGFGSICISEAAGGSGLGRLEAPADRLAEAHRQSKGTAGCHRRDPPGLRISHDPEVYH